MQQPFNYFRIFYPQIRKISTNFHMCQNHYDALGISAKATQADVKSAYYKLSMVYHPDKNTDEKSAQKFRDITAAYEVLGNVKSRKLYDRGLYFGKREGAFEEAPDHKFYKSRDTRSRPPAPPGKTIYDFDEWSRAHYGATFRRDMKNREKARMENLKRDQTKDVKNEQIVLLVGLSLLLAFYAIQSKDLDKITSDVKVIGENFVVVPKKDS